jgi:hypothetical protein
MGTDKEKQRIEEELNQMTSSMKDVWKALMGDNSKPDEPGFFEQHRQMKREMDLFRAQVDNMRSEFMERLTRVSEKTDSNANHLGNFNMKLAGIIGGITVIGYLIQFWLNYRQGK